MDLVDLSFWMAGPWISVFSDGRVVDLSFGLAGLVDPISVLPGGWIPFWFGRVS